MRLTVLDRKDLSVLGSFGKAIDGSASLNFGLSAGKHCDTQCPHHSANGGMCYAVRTEVRPDRRELVNKLQRHENSSAADVCERAIDELGKRKRRVPWFRISTNGSVPRRIDARFREQFKRLLTLLRDKGVPVHLPIETARKAARYRRVFGELVTVRESATSLGRFLRAACAVSCVVGTREQTRLERVAAAKAAASERTRRTGRKCVVCPAVAARYNNGNKPAPKAKCGNCVACADASIDIVYPLH